MPVIPGANESQVLNSGSPVPIGSDSEARYQGDTIAAFGRGISVLGSTLEKAANDATKEKNRLQVLNAANQLMMKALEKRADQQAAAPIANDATGFGAVKSYAANLKPDIEDLAGQIEDPTARAEFMVHAGQTMNEESVKIWADEVKKRGEQNKELTQQLVSSSGQIAWRDPTQIDNEMAKTETAILDSSDIPNDQKQVKVGEARRSIIMDAVQGRLESKQWGQAQAVLDSYADVGGFSSKEKAAMLDEVRNSKWNDVNRTAKQETFQYSARMRELKEPWIKMKYGMFALIAQEGTDPQDVQKTLDVAVAANVMPAEQAEAIMNPHPIPPEQDQNYSKSVVSEAIKSGDFESALVKVGEEAGVKVSPKAGVQLRDNLIKLRNQMQADPVFSKKVENVDRALEGFAAPSMTNGMSPQEKSDLFRQVEGAKSQFYNKLAMDPKQDPATLSGEIVQHALSYTYRFPEVKSAQSLAEIQKVGEDLIRNREMTKQKGLLTEAIDNDYVSKLREIQRRKQELSLGVRSK